MSHTLHRFGTVDDLKNDYCIYARCAKSVNRDHPGDKLRKILSIYLSENVINFGSCHAGKCYLDGLSPAEYAKEMDTAYSMNSNFADRQSVENVLCKIRDAELGISIVVSGLIDEVADIAQKCNLKLHTATISLGIFGDKSLIPDDETLKVTTMCGHSLVGNSLVESVQKLVEAGELSAEEAASLLAKSCTCGIFNVVRYVALSKKWVAE